MEDQSVFMIDQNLLPFDFQIIRLNNYLECCDAIITMKIRGAGAIGAMAGFAMALAALQHSTKKDQSFLFSARKEIESTRPTARNLFYATEKVFDAALVSADEAIKMAQWIADKDAEDSRQIGIFGNELIRDGFRIETHCNAGWLAFVDFGTALSPVYTAHQEGKKVFVYVDETRPRSQGARLTAWELHQAGIPHSIIPDNAGAHIMSLGNINLMITGADRIAMNGDVANKIGTLEKAIVAKEYGVPFFVAAPLSTFDHSCETGKDIPIEERSGDEVLFQDGVDRDGKLHRIRVASPGSGAMNPAFDVTPSKFITGIITEKGIIPATREAI